MNANIEKTSEKIGIFGGSFNPVHSAHVEFIKKVQQKYHFSKLYVVPCNIQPLKGKTDGSISATNATERMKLLSLALADCDPAISVSDYEIKKQGKSYSIDTIEYFKGIHPQSEFFLVMGTDSFATLDRWMRFEDLIKSCKFIVAKRKCATLESDLKRACQLRDTHGDIRLEVLDLSLPEVSSTQIRSEK